MRARARVYYFLCAVIYGRDGVEWNGMEWNGMEWNGMEWNGMEWNGMKWMEWSAVSKRKSQVNSPLQSEATASLPD